MARTASSSSEPRAAEKASILPRAIEQCTLTEKEAHGELIRRRNMYNVQLRNHPQHEYVRSIFTRALESFLDPPQTYAARLRDAVRKVDQLLGSGHASDILEESETTAADALTPATDKQAPALTRSSWGTQEGAGSTEPESRATTTAASRPSPPPPRQLRSKSSNANESISTVEATSEAIPPNLPAPVQIPASADQPRAVQGRRHTSTATLTNLALTSAASTPVPTRVMPTRALKGKRKANPFDKLEDSVSPHKTRRRRKTTSSSTTSAPSSQPKPADIPVSLPATLPLPPSQIGDPSAPPALYTPAALSSVRTPPKPPTPPTPKTPKTSALIFSAHKPRLGVVLKVSPNFLHVLDNCKARDAYIACLRSQQSSTNQSPILTQSPIVNQSAIDNQSLIVKLQLPPAHLATLNSVRNATNAFPAAPPTKYASLTLSQLKTEAQRRQALYQDPHLTNGLAELFRTIDIPEQAASGRRKAGVAVPMKEHEKTGTKYDGHMLAAMVRDGQSRGIPLGGNVWRKSFMADLLARHDLQCLLRRDDEREDGTAVDGTMASGTMANGTMGGTMASARIANSTMATGTIPNGTTANRLYAINKIREFDDIVSAVNAMNRVTGNHPLDATEDTTPTTLNTHPNTRPKTRPRTRPNTTTTPTATAQHIPKQLPRKRPQNLPFPPLPPLAPGTKREASRTALKTGVSIALENIIDDIESLCKWRQRRADGECEDSEEDNYAETILDMVELLEKNKPTLGGEKGDDRVFVLRGNEWVFAAVRVVLEGLGMGEGEFARVREVCGVVGREFERLFGEGVGKKG
ncbi:hypothetical protein M011DRAFT_456100 [Sporormia fimetaria CBS 119925]|uniref:Uncharacterized protein n=1 Tax=Sporormia fimetaria CBS 119925 TaxID=1340428 RepID=A0A6A6VJ29_9PLEO|nr:hypothetical protein M011DRAFT_456100 [Sporormia fimetaria CBS 119925]